MFARGCIGGFVQYIIVLIALFTVVGCVAFVSETTRRSNASRATNGEPVPQTKPGHGGKAAAPAPLAQKPADDKPPGYTRDLPKPRPEAIVPSSDRKKARRSSLARQLKIAAYELAKKHYPVRKMQLCHIAKDDEWWLLLYKDIGSVIDVRHFIWNWEKQKFKPFLVVKRIPISKLSSHLKKKVPGRTCKFLTPPTKGADDPVERLWK